MRPNELGLWAVVGVVLAGFSIPWFLWGSATVVAGLPVWLWWHIGWMGVVSVVFWVFTQRAWGIGIERDGSGDESAEQSRIDPTRETRSDGESP